VLTVNGYLNAGQYQYHHSLVANSRGQVHGSTMHISELSLTNLFFLKPKTFHIAELISLPLKVHLA